MKMNNSVSWQWFHFDELTNKTLYAILQLRSDVFVVEQACAYQDLDNIDFDALHLCGFIDGQLVAYLRVFEESQYARIGRVVNSPTVRGQGIGRALMQQAITDLKARFPNKHIEMSAQLYLEPFYQSLGFRTISEPYQEDSIPHIRMSNRFECE